MFVIKQHDYEKNPTQIEIMGKFLEDGHEPNSLKPLLHYFRCLVSMFFFQNTKKMFVKLNNMTSFILLRLKKLLVLYHSQLLLCRSQFLP